ncbi:MAG: hypothetical protein KF807_00245 [Xanthobacteraceae bacterium]|nr:hypothetical protein [Xanthobacteraceae bacterium]
MTDDKKKIIPDETVRQMKEYILFGTPMKTPPLSTQYQKGPPGSPKGRPRRQDVHNPHSVEKLVLKELDRIVPVRDGSGTDEISVLAAIIRALIASAASKQRVYAARLLLMMYRDAQKQRYQRIREENERWEQYIRDYETERRRAKETGFPPPARLPFPEDVVIGEEGVSFTGPVSEEGALACENASQFRNVCIMQHALDLRCADSEVAVDTVSLSLLLAMMIDIRLPKRCQLSETEYVMRYAKLSGMPRRQLLKEVYQAWKALGATIPRGQTFPIVNAEQINEIQQMFTSKAAA